MILGCAGFAHRGLWSEDGPPENSIAAFKAAAAAGVGIELDVQLASDGVPIVFHDPMLDRMTEASGAVWHRSTDELTSLKLTGSDEHIPTLSAALTALPKGTPVLVELKASPGDHGDYLSAVDKALFGAPAECAVMSFVWGLNEAAAQVMPDRTRGTLAQPDLAGSGTPLQQRIAASAALSAHFTSLHHSDVAAGRDLLGPTADLATWTVDDEAALQIAAQANAAIIFEKLNPALVLTAAVT
ncbi:MAG: glycerophosphodiester phosphodiesterase family protein [Pseudomonadota bacterium]